MAKTVEEKYKSLSDTEHVLHRPGMYVGSVVTEICEKYVLEDDKFKSRSLNYNAGFLKIFDEIISNSVDESKREGTKLNTIKVSVDQKSGTIEVLDNGGIPVVIHKETKRYIPSMCMSEMRSGSNFNDDENRTGVGTNGLGSVATNILSSEFRVETADGKNKFKQVFKNNLSKKGKIEVTPTSQHYTKITYIPDFGRFGMSGIDDDSYKLLEARVYEVAGTNPNLKVYFNGKNISVKSFKGYCQMYTDEVIYEENENWKVGISTSDKGFESISFVNGGNTPRGSHVDYIMNQIIPKIREKLQKKYKTDITPSQIKQHMRIFVCCNVYKPAYNSQSKDTLITEQKNFGTSITLSDKFINQILKSEIINLITDWLDQKKSADDKKAERDANKSLGRVRIEKLVDCKWAGGINKRKTSLSITEGDSAAAGFRKFRDPNTQALFPIRGKILNVRTATKDKVLANEEIKGIMAAMGLKFGQSPFVYRGNHIVQDNLRIHEIRIMTDSDTDGADIAGLLLNIFAYYWPELIKEHRIARVDTPILIARKGKTEIKFYNQSEFDEWSKKNDTTKWDIEYYKGLGALQDNDYKDLIQNPNIYYYDLDGCALDELEVWFGKDSDKRKERLQ